MLFKEKAAQGDLFISRVKTLPKGLKKENPVKGRYIVTHSETGHHHVMDAEKSIMYKDPTNPLICYLVVDQMVDLLHLRSFDTHDPLTFDKGIYRCHRQREYIPEGWRKVVD